MAMGLLVPVEGIDAVLAKDGTEGRVGIETMLGKLGTLGIDGSETEVAIGALSRIPFTVIGPARILMIGAEADRLPLAADRLSVPAVNRPAPEID